MVLFLFSVQLRNKYDDDDDDFAFVMASGYRHVSLRNECNQPQGLATLFVHIRVTDYIPDAFAGIRTCFSHVYIFFALVRMY